MRKSFLYFFNLKLRFNKKSILVNYWPIKLTVAKSTAKYPNRYWLKKKKLLATAKLLIEFTGSPLARRILHVYRDQSHKECKVFVWLVQLLYVVDPWCVTWSIWTLWLSIECGTGTRDMQNAICCAWEQGLIQSWTAHAWIHSEPRPRH